MDARIDPALSERLRTVLNGEHVVDDLRRYFAEVEPPDDYTGRWYDQLGGSADPAAANRFTGEDIVAVSMLSLRVAPRVSWRILRTDAADLTALLKKIPTDIDLWNATDDQIDGTSAAHEIWHRLKSMAIDGGNDGHAPVTASKLLARKRPRLIPVYDRQVKALLQLPRRTSWWLSLRQALDAETVTTIRQLGQQAGVPPISVLRTLDVILWMHARRSARR
jgi:hypothetical protein